MGATFETGAGPHNEWTSAVSIWQMGRRATSGRSGHCSGSDWHCQDTRTLWSRVRRGLTSGAWCVTRSRYLLVERHKPCGMQAVLCSNSTFSASRYFKMYRMYVQHCEEFVNCVYLCNCLQRARGRSGGAGLRPNTIMDTITLPPHYSLTWPHHYHSNNVNQDDSDALSSLSFIISTYRKMSCFSSSHINR